MGLLEEGADAARVRRELEATYGEMHARQLKGIAAGGFKPDAGLAAGAIDGRRCLATYSLFGSDADVAAGVASASWEPTAAFAELAAELRAAVPTAVHYEASPSAEGWLHFTSMQLVGFNELAETEVPQPVHADCVGEAICSRLPEFSIEFVGIVPVPSGVVIAGVPTADVNGVREEIRAALQNKGLPLREPYKNDIVHATLVRLRDPVPDAARDALLALCEKFAPFKAPSLGTARISEVRYSRASWRMQLGELSPEPTRRFVLAPQRCAVITHRGLEPDNPGAAGESTYEAFADQCARGFGLEFDPNPCKDGFVVWHDATAKRLTGGSDERPFREMATAEALELRFGKGRIASLDEVLELIAKSPAGAGPSAMHLKGDRQDEPSVRALCDVLARHPRAVERMFCFDARPETAALLRELAPALALAPSVSHPHDVARYNGCVHGTLWSVEQACASRDTFKWAWLDEWDLADAGGGRKELCTAATFATMRASGMRVGLVTPELHASSPGLLGGEAHEDARDRAALSKRLARILALRPDAVCTDHPQEALEMTSPKHAA